MDTRTVQSPIKEATDKKTDFSNINCIEEPARDGWFVEQIDGSGAPLVYLRVRITGMLPRLVGPFASKAVALWCLDEVVSRVTEDVEWTMSNLYDAHAVKRPGHGRFNKVIVEDPITRCARPPQKPAKKSMKPSPRNHRWETGYWVCCDCRNCREETGRSFMALGFSCETEGEAIQALERYSREHPSCFVARETMEPIEAPRAEKAQRNPRKRKVA